MLPVPLSLLYIIWSQTYFMYIRYKENEKCKIYKLRSLFFLPKFQQQKDNLLFFCLFIGWHFFYVSIIILEMCVCVLRCLTHFFKTTSMYISICMSASECVCVCELMKLKNASFEYISSRTFWVWHNLYTLYTHRWIQLPQSRSTIQARILILLNSNLYTMLYVGHCLMGIILAGSRCSASASVVR